MDLTPHPQAPIADSTGALPSAWAAWLSKVQLLVNASVQSGTTANRPTQGLFTGRFYFDTSLAAGVGRPIWRNAANTAWVDADGVAV